MKKTFKITYRLLHAEGDEYIYLESVSEKAVRQQFRRSFEPYWIIIKISEIKP